MDVVVIKTVGGEEVIAGVVSNTPDSFKVSKPRLVIKTETPNGIGISLVPWLMAAPDFDVEIANSIMAVVPAPSDIASRYLELVSGIVMPSGKLQ